MKYVARFLLVSKLWAKIIRSQDFIRSFPFRSSLKPHQLIAFKYIDNENERQILNVNTIKLLNSYIKTSKYSLIMKTFRIFPVYAYQICLQFMMHI